MRACTSHLSGFSGSDIFMKVLEYLQVDFRERYGHCLTFKTVFQAESGSEQQGVPADSVPGHPDHGLPRGGVIRSAPPGSDRFRLRAPRDRSVDTIESGS